MRFRSLATLSVLALAAGIACKTLTEAAESQPASTAARAKGSATAAKPEGNRCLRCHGPFDKLVKKPAKYTAPSGEKINPHRYVPHDSKLVKDVPDCTNCHTPHPAKPRKGSIDLTKVTVQWCYGCHHVNNLTSCKECHP